MNKIDVARRVLEKKRRSLAGVQVELQVKNTKHARSKEVIAYCIKELSSGTTWSELRRKLGVGPMHVDSRWRIIRSLLTSAVLPENEEEALIAQANANELMLAKLEELTEFLEERAQQTRGKEKEHQFLKLYIETLKMQAERNEQKFNAYVKIKELQKSEMKNQGPSIIYQNNYYIPRPGDSDEKVRTVVEHNESQLLKAAMISSKAEEFDDNSE